MEAITGNSLESLRSAVVLFAPKSEPEHFDLDCYSDHGVDISYMYR